MEFLVATTNPGKLAEVEAILRSLPIKIISLTDLKGWPTVIEDGKTFEENALKKARTLADFSGYMTLADDSGLEVDALGGGPGIFSARYSGAEGDDIRNNEKLLYELEAIPQEKRGARFVCVLALCSPILSGKNEWFFHGECSGQITFSPRGENGFGYDSLFFYPPLGKTFAEISREEKGYVSHRGKALKKLTDSLPSILSRMRNP